MGDDAVSLEECEIVSCSSRTVRETSVQQRTRTVRGREELPCALPPPPPPQDTDANGNEGAGVGVGAGSRARRPPRRRTADGTDIYYWCDLPRRNCNGASTVETHARNNTKPVFGFW